MTGLGVVTIAPNGSTIRFDIDGNPIPLSSNVPHAVELVVQPNGSYVVTVVSQLNHSGVGEDVRTLPVVTLNGTSPTGAIVTVPLTITVQDDICLLYTSRCV